MRPSPTSLSRLTQASTSTSRFILPPHPHRSTSSIPRPLHTSRSFTSSARRSLPVLDNILAAENDPNRLSILKQTPRGFHLTDDLVVPGGLVLIDGQPLLWDVDPPNLKGRDLNEYWVGLSRDAFKVFEVVLPRPEMLVFGTGISVVPPPKEIREYISGLGIQLEVMDSRNAASTFNMLQEEGRRVALALCPVTPIDPKTGKERS